jgi:hypothetical protein
MATRAQQQQMDTARAQLREILQPGDQVSTILRHVSASGMTRSISLIICSEGEPWDITYLAARAMGEKVDNYGGIRIPGAGMDMGAHIVYSLARYLWPDGFDCIGDGDRAHRCPSNDHHNGDRDYTPHRHEDGGYALRHRWL